MQNGTPTLATVREWLEEIRQPLRDKLAELEAREEQLRAELRDVAEAKREVNRLLPSSPKQPKPVASQQGRPPEEIEAMVRDFIVGHDPEGEVIASVLYRKMREANALDGVGEGRIQKAVKGLHRRGVLRAVRRTPGGGQAYRLTAARGAAT